MAHFSTSVHLMDMRTISYKGWAIINKAESLFRYVYQTWTMDIQFPVWTQHKRNQCNALATLANSLKLLKIIKNIILVNISTRHIILTQNHFEAVSLLLPEKRHIPI